jgi:hypothetical protein
LPITCLFAQARFNYQREYTIQSGKVQVKVFTDKIFKITFRPHNYARTKNISAAIVAKPEKKSTNNKLVLCGSFVSANHHGRKIILNQMKNLR